MKRITPLSVFVCLGLLFAASTCFAQLDSSITVFDVPGASSTNPVSINNNGDVVGWYCDSVCDDAWARNPTHFRRGFVREANGNITTFDGIPTGINDAGVIVGYFFDFSADTSGLHCCFVRERQGNTSVFGVPVVNPAQRFHWGISVAVNNRGEIAGYIIPGLNALGFIEEITYGFVRNQQGLLTTFVLPISAYPTSINARGDVTGTNLPPWWPGSNWNGFVRDRSGDITSFVAPGGDDPGGGCYGPLAVPVSINNRGDIAGHFYSHTPPCRWRSFVRKTDGSFAVFDATQDTTSDSSVIAINEQGDVFGRTAGPYSQIAQQYFLRDKQGEITLIDVPSGPFNTFAVPNGSGAINDRGDVTGTFNNQGFIRIH